MQLQLRRCCLPTYLHQLTPCALRAVVLWVLRRCCLPTCTDRNAVATGLQPWVCPIGTLTKPANALKNPPNNTVCCLVSLSAHIHMPAAVVRPKKALPESCACPYAATEGRQPMLNMGSKPGHKWDSSYSCALLQPYAELLAFCRVFSSVPTVCWAAYCKLRSKACPGLLLMQRLTLLVTAAVPATLLLVQPTCYDTNLGRRGNQTFICPTGMVINPANAAFNPPSQDTCCMRGVSVC
jgi:hypothetical protein